MQEDVHGANQGGGEGRGERQEDALLHLGGGVALLRLGGGVAILHLGGGVPLLHLGGGVADDPPHKSTVISNMFLHSKTRC